MNNINNNFYDNEFDQNHFNAYAHNFEQYLGNSQVNQNVNQNNFEVPNNQGNGVQNRLNEQQNINIPQNNREEFDLIAANMLSKGNRSIKELVNQLRGNKFILVGNPSEVAQIDLAELASGTVKQVTHWSTRALKYPYMKDVTSVQGARQFCIQHPVIKEQVPYRQPLNQHLNIRVKTYVTYSQQFWQGLISSLAHDEQIAHITKASNNKLEKKLHNENQKVGKWYSSSDDIHIESNCKKSYSVSKNMSNKMDMLSLMKNDPVFQSMFLKNEVNGIDSQMRQLKNKMRQEEGGFTTNYGSRFQQMNQDVVNDAHVQMLNRLKTKEKILLQMMSKDEQVKSKFIFQLVNLGITDVTNWNFDNLNTYNQNILYNGTKKSVEMIQTMAKNEKCEYIMRKILANQITNFFLER